MEVLELVDAGVRHVNIAVVHHRRALEISDLLHFPLKVDRAPAQVPSLVIEETVDWTGVNHGKLAEHVRLVEGLGRIEEVRIEMDLDIRVIGHSIQPSAITVGRKSLIRIVEVAVVVVKAHWQAVNNCSWQILRVCLPLLRRVPLNECLEERATDQRNALRLEILVRALALHFISLLLEQLAGLVWGVVGAEELVDSAEVHRHREHFAVHRGIDLVHVIRERRELVDVIPHALVGRVENMGAIAVNFDTSLRIRLGVAVAANMRSAVDHCHLDSLLSHTLSHSQTKNTGTHYQEVSLHRTTAFYRLIFTSLMLADFAFVQSYIRRFSGRRAKISFMLSKPISHSISHGIEPKRINGVLRVIGLAILGIALVVSSAAVTMYSRLQANVVQHSIAVPEAERPEPVIPLDQKSGQPINILVLGSDVREGSEDDASSVEGMRSDTTMVAHISADRSRVDIVSIPRDTLVNIPSCTLPDGTQTWEQYDAMFNSAFQTGGATGDVGAAASCTLRTIENMTGMLIDGFVVVNFKSFQDVVDTLGGVEMCFAQPIDDYAAQLKIDAGCHVLDGKTALGVARVRYTVGDGSDTSRIGRQQELVYQIMKKLLSTEVLTNVPQMYQLLTDVTSEIDTSEGLGNLSWLGGLGYSLRNLDTSNIHMITMPWAPDFYDPNRVRATPAADLLWEALRNDQEIPLEAIQPADEQSEVLTENRENLPTVPEPETPTETQNLDQAQVTQ